MHTKFGRLSCIFLLLGISFTACIQVPTPASTSTPLPTDLLTSTPIPQTPSPVPQQPTSTPTPLPPLAQAWGTRQEISLDGKWEYVKTKSLDVAPPVPGWQAIDIPGTLSGYNYERAWFRRTFTAPATWSGQRLLLHFGGVKFNSRVFVNGQNVGGAFNGYDAFELDVTEAIKLGANNELLVGVNDWTGVFTGSQTSFPTGLDLNVMRDSVSDQILSPVGGMYWAYGIWDSVLLRVVSPVYVQSYFVRPLVQQNRIEVDVTIRNASTQAFAGSLQARIFDWYGTSRDSSGQWELRGAPIAIFSSSPVSVAPSMTTSLILVLDKPPLQQWTPYSPHLYLLELGFGPSNLDALRTRIGFREISLQNGDFYLNGKKVHLLATSYWPPAQSVSRDYIAGELKAIRAMNAVAFRTHTQPWRDLWYEVADEIGLMMIPEGAIWNDDTAYRLDDQKFWDNYSAHLTAMVNNLRNHPSIVMWSLENEMFGSRAQPGSRAEVELGKLGTIVKRADPTRPITYESDGDPAGATDVIGIHYPNEYPDHRLWPQDAYWLDTPRLIHGGGGMFWNGGPFLWDHKKPLYIGEYMWEPERDPSSNTLLYGDEAYVDFKSYRTSAKAFAWRMQSLAYRTFNVSGHSPWTAHEEGAMDETNPTWVAQRDLYRPLAAFTREYDSRFYSGDVVTRTVDIFNDTMSDLSSVQYRWMLLDGDKKLTEANETLAMASGDHQTRALQISIPQVDARKSLKLRLTMNVGPDERFRQEYAVDVFPRSPHWKLPDTPIVLFDPNAGLSKLLTENQIAFRSLKQLRDWDGQGLLIVGPNALSKATSSSDAPVIGDPAGEWQWLSDMVNNGGRILTLEQDVTASDSLPVRLGAQSSTLAFPQMPSHPILQGITSDDLRWWRGDNIVSRNEPVRAAYAGVYPLIVTGSGRGIANAPLVEVQQGKGVWLVSQLQIVSKLNSEPMAQILLERMLNYLAAYRPGIGNVLFLGPSSLGDQLAPLSIATQPLTDWTQLRFPQTQLLVMQTNAATINEHIDQLRAFLNDGGQVVWHRPDPNDFPKVQAALKLPLTMHPYQGFSLRTEGNGGLLDSLTREDLYWLGQAAGPGWSETPLANDMADFTFASTEKISPETTLPATQNVQLDGQIVRVQGKEIAFSTNGRATWKVNIPGSGMHLFGLIARGTPVKEIFPLVTVFLDGRRIGTLNVGKRETDTFTFPFRAEAGSHQLTIAYTNDLFSPPEDRNLYVQSYFISPISTNANVELLTTPPTLASVALGKGRLVLDAIHWDDAGRNAPRAQHFIASLLTALGAHFQGRANISAVEAETLTPMANFKFFEKQGDVISMPTNGYVEGPIRFATGGRYRIGIVAKGTPADGIYPIVALQLDNRIIGQVEIKSDGYSTHYIVADLPAGTVNLRLRFTNDLWRPEKGEDRNLWVDRLEFELLP